MAQRLGSKRDHSPPENSPNMSDLRIVLLGKNVSENNRVGNFILEKNVFGKKTPQPDVEVHSERVERRNITVIKTNNLLNSVLKLQTIAHKVSAFSPPEPDVIILVLQHKNFNENNRDRLHSVLNCFCEQAMKRTMIVTTDETCDPELTSEENEFIQEISTECGGGRFQLQNTQRSQILQKVDEIITHSEFKQTQHSSSLDQEHSRSVCSVRTKERATGFDDQRFGIHDETQRGMKDESSSQKHDKRQRRRSQSEERPNMCDLRIVLLGKNLSENCKVRNSILGIDVHENEVPTSLQKHNVTIVSGKLDNRHVTVINTLHLLNPNISDHQITQAVRECVDLSDPGPHVFILVLQYNDFTEEDMRRVKYVLKEFSEEAIKRTIVITTDVETHNPHTLSPAEMNTAIHHLKEYGGRHLQFKMENPKWQSEILKTVNKILKENNEECLTCEIYVIASADEKQIRSDYPARSEEKNKERSYHKDDRKPKERSELIDIREWSRSNLLANSSKKQKLNLVLCGSDGTLTVSVSKLLRGIKIKSHQRESSEECVNKEEKKIHGHLINLVELPAFSRLSEEEVMRQTLRCVSLCDPGVHVFLFIVNFGRLTNDDKAEMEKIQKTFYSKKHFIVIFINDTVNISVTDLIKSSPEFQKLISRCGGLFCVMGLKEPDNSRQIPELLDFIENMKTEPYSAQMYVKAQENRARCETEEKYKEELKKMENNIKELKQKIQSYGAEAEPDDQECLRIVLIGRTGSGKSATGNTILGRKEFYSRMSTNSVTTDCQKGAGEVDGRSVAVVDTPGIFDTGLSNEQVVEEIMKCVSLSSPGPHVFVIVLSLGRFTKEETDTLGLIKKIFGHKSAQFSIVLFTRGDELDDESIEEYVRESNSAELKKLITDCGNRFLAFNNKEKQDKSQVIQLLNMIEEVKNTNKGRYFTNSLFEEAEMSIKKRMEEILKDKEREIQTQREELQTKYEMEKKNMMESLEEEKRKADEEKMKMENQFREKEEKLRKEFEEKEKTEQNKRETENQKQSEKEEQQRAEYHQKIEEMKREIENQRSQYEKQQKKREEEDREREEKYRHQEKMKFEQELMIAELQRKQEEEIKKRESEEKMRNKEEEEERQRWIRKIKEAENDRKETQEEIKRQQREWEDEKKRQTREREEEERKRKEKHEEQLKEKQEELEKMRKKFEREREEERQKIEDERQKQRREREEKEREYKDKKTEMKRHYEQLERERKEEWERRKREDEERREEERKTWKKMIEDLKLEQEEEIKRRDKERKVREEEVQDKITQKYEDEINVMKKKHEDEARKQAEELNDFKVGKEQLQKMLEEHQEQHEILEKLYQLLQFWEGKEIKELQQKVEKLYQQLKEQKGEELKELKEVVEKLLQLQEEKKTALQEAEALKKKSGRCVIL